MDTQPPTDPIWWFLRDDDRYWSSLDEQSWKYNERYNKRMATALVNLISNSPELQAEIHRLSEIRD